MVDCNVLIKLFTMRSYLLLCFVSAVLLFPATIFAYVDCRDTPAGCSLSELIAISAQTNLPVEDRRLVLTQAIEMLQKQLSTMIANGAASENGTCIDLQSNLMMGSTDAATNGGVSKLQRFLVAAGVYPEASVTGYYGNATAAAVVRLQKAKGMGFVTVKSGVGPMTREKLKCVEPEIISTLPKMRWVVELVNPTMSDDDSYKKYEQSVAADVTKEGGGTKRYVLDNAYGCDKGAYSVSTGEERRVIGKVSCYMAASAVDFLAYRQNEKLVFERHDHSAKDGTITKTVVLEL